MQTRGKLGSKSRNRSSKSSVSSISSGNGKEDIVFDPISGKVEKEHSVSQPVTLERGSKGFSQKSSGGSLPRSPFFGSKKQEKGGLFQLSCMTHKLYFRGGVKFNDICSSI